MLCCAIILQIKDELKRYFPANTEFDQWKTFLYQQTQIVNVSIVSLYKNILNSNKIWAQLVQPYM